MKAREKNKNRNKNWKKERDEEGTKKVREMENIRDMLVTAETETEVHCIGKLEQYL